MPALPARIIHIGIDRNWRDVYAYASEPARMPEWAAGLASGLTPDGDTWLADGGPIGQVRVRFTPLNDFGVIDHSVTMPDGVVVKNALRVLPNGDGAEVVFLLQRRPGVDESAFEADAAHVRKDLQTLRDLLQSGADQTGSQASGGSS